MTKISDELHAIATQKPAGFHRGIVQVEFNAWHYMETNIWASLVEVIFRQLDAAVRGQAGSESRPSLMEQLSTAQTMRIEAVESLAGKIRQTAEARKAVQQAEKNFAKNGPDGETFWQCVLQEMEKTGADDFKKVAENLGYGDLILEASNLRNISTDLHSTIELVRYAARLGLIDMELW